MCSIAARISANALEIAIHDVRVDVSQRWMLEGSGEAADDIEAKALPQAHGTLVSTDYKIELHRAKSAPASAAQRMLTHRACDPATGRCHGCHVPAIRNVRSATLLIRLQKIGADNFAILFCNEDLMPGR